MVGAVNKSGSSGDSLNDASNPKDYPICQVDNKVPSVHAGTPPGVDWGGLTTGQKARLLTRKLLTEGHTFGDGILVVAACQIGQIMLVMPRAMWMTGVIPGVAIMLVTITLGAWTVYLLIAFFQEYKTRKLMEGTWYDSDSGTVRRHVTQYHEVIRYFVGPWLAYIVQGIVLLVLLGVGVAQILATSSDYFYINPTHNKRTYGIIWGGCMMVFMLIPSYQHMRVFNVLALVGTLYTAAFIVGRSSHRLTSADQDPISGQVMLYPRSMAGFFGGGVILMSALGSHVISMELIEVMKNSHKFFKAFAIAECYVLLITLPHSVLVNFAYPGLIAMNDNVYGVLPRDGWLFASIWLMILHQILVFGFVMLPVFFMAEKLFRVHTRSIWLRYMVRIPIVALVFLIAIAFPYYSSINAVLGAIGTPAVSFVIPCLAYNWVYRSQAARDTAAMPPLQISKSPRVNWRVTFLLNYFVAALFGIAGGGFGIFYAFYNLVSSVRSFGFFPGWSSQQSEMSPTCPFSVEARICLFSRGQDIFPDACRLK